MSNANSVVLMAVGDVGPVIEPVDPLCALAQPVLAAADIRFGQCERVYSERGALQLHSGGAHRSGSNTNFDDICARFN